MDAVFIECFGELKEPRVERTKKHLHRLLQNDTSIAPVAILSVSRPSPWLPPRNIIKPDNSFATEPDNLFVRYKNRKLA